MSIGMNTPTLPPATLTDDSLRLAGTLLQLCADPAAAKSRLDELGAQMAALRAEIDGHAAAKKSADDAAAALADVEQRAKDLAAREDALIRDSARLQAASAAIADRDQTVKDREAEVAKLEQQFAAKLKAHEDRIAQVRASLA